VFTVESDESHIKVFSFMTTLLKTTPSDRVN